MSVVLEGLKAPSTEDARRMIEQLSALENHDHRVFSLFLTLDPSVSTGRNLRALLHDVLQPIRTRLGTSSPEYQEVLHAADEALAAIEQLPDDARGVASYVCAKTAFKMTVALPFHVEPRAYWDRRAWLGPLRALANPRNWLLILVADKIIGRLLVAGFDEIHELGTVVDRTPAKHEQGAEAQSNIARRHDEWVRRHARTIGHELGLLGRALHVGGLAISAPPEMLAVLRAELPPRFAGLPVDDFRVAADASTAQILEHARQLIQQRDANYDQALVETLSEAVGRNRAALGITHVASAIVSAQVHVLACEEGLALRGATCAQCELILPIEHAGPCPVCAGAVNEQNDFVEYLADRVVRQGGAFESVRSDSTSFLRVNGGIAALLRSEQPSYA